MQGTSDRPVRGSMSVAPGGGDGQSKDCDLQLLTEQDGAPGAMPKTPMYLPFDGSGAGIVGCPVCTGQPWGLRNEFCV